MKIDLVAYEFLQLFPPGVIGAAGFVALALQLCLHRLEHPRLSRLDHECAPGAVLRHGIGSPALFVQLCLVWKQPGPAV